MYYPLAFVVFLWILYMLYRPAFVVLAFIGVGAVSRMYQRFLRGISLGIETIIFGVTVAGRLYGVWSAILIGIISLPLSIVYTEEDVKWLPVALGGMVIIGVLSAYLPPTNIVLLGMTLTLVYDVTTCAVYLLLFHSNLFKTLLFIGSHLAFNYLLFSRFGETVLSLLA